MRWTLLALCLAGCTGTIASSPEAGPAVTIARSSGQAGSTVEVAVELRPAQASVSALQLDLALPEGVAYVSVSPGPVAVEAGKLVVAAAEGDRLRVAIAGANQLPLSAGRLATLRLTLGSSPGTAPLSVATVVAAGPDAAQVAIAAEAGSLTTAQ